MIGNSGPILSICIPTYNRADYITKLLNSIIIQDPKNIEIIISDNASTDNTQELLQEFIKKFPWLKYSRSDKNIGFDGNMKKIIELASGKYCWTVGSDDMLEINSISVIINYIQKFSPDIILFNKIDIDLNSIPVKKVKIFKDSFGIKTFSSLDNRSLITYFTNASNSNVFFTYMSCFIFKREVWKITEECGKFEGTHYLHAAIMLRGLRNGIELRFIPDFLILHRINNDSFSEIGKEGNRVFHDYVNYYSLANIFNDQFEIQTAILLAARREHGFLKMVKCFALISDHIPKGTVISTVKKLRYPSLMIFISSIFYKSKYIIQRLLLVKHKFDNSKAIFSKLYNKNRYNHDN